MAVTRGEDDTTQLKENTPETPSSGKKLTKKEQYKVLRFLGDGSYATVYEAIHLVTGRHCALKIFDKATLRKGQDKAIVNEIKIMSKLRHPNIVGLIDAFETKTKVYVAMEIASGGELWEKLCNIGYYCEADAAHLLYQLLSSVQHLHEHGIVHRDIKPENLLFSDKSPTSRLMLADFGLAEIICRDISPELLDTVCGTSGYMAPEVLLGTGYLGQQADIWSVGMVAYFLLSGTSPFDENKLDEAEGSQHPAYELLKQYKSVMDCCDPDEAACASECVITFTPEETWAQISNDAKDFVSSLLYYRPSARPTAAQALQHPWIQKYLQSTHRGNNQKGAHGCSHERSDHLAESSDKRFPTKETPSSPTILGRRASIERNRTVEGTHIKTIIEDQHQVPMMAKSLTPEGVLGSPNNDHQNSHTSASSKSTTSPAPRQPSRSPSPLRSSQQSDTVRGQKRSHPSMRRDGSLSPGASSDGKREKTSDEESKRRSEEERSEAEESSCQQCGQQNTLPNIGSHLREHIQKSNTKRKTDCHAKAKERWENVRKSLQLGKPLTYDEVKESFDQRHGWTDDEEMPEEQS